MKLIGSLENFQPSSLLQWFQTERADGVLAVQGRPGYRLRFERGELVAASHWPPGESLERRLKRALGEARAEELRLEAEIKCVPLSELLVDFLGREETVRLVTSHAEGVIFRLLEEKEGRFFFDPPAAELPASLRCRFHISQILLERARRQDEEERLGEWIPSAGSTLKLVSAPSLEEDESQTGIRGELVENLRELRSRRQLESMIPVESHTVRLKLAELIRSGNVEVLAETPVAPGLAETSSGSAPTGLLQLNKSATADDWPFLTSAEARLLEGLREGPRSLEDASRTLRQDRQELTPVAELLADTGWISVQDAPAPLPVGKSRWRPVLAGAAVVAVLAVLGVFSAPLFQGSGGPSGSETAVAQETRPPAVAAPVAAPAERRAEEPEDEAPSPPPIRPPSPSGETRKPKPRAKSPADSPTRPEPKAKEETEARIDRQLEAEIGSAREALAESDLPAAQDALGRAAALRPGDPRLSELWKEIQEASVPAPVEPGPNETEAAESVALGKLALGKLALGKLMVNAVPYGFVRVNGEDRGATPLTLELAPGVYEVRVFRAGYVPVVRSVELESETVFLESFNLEKAEPDEEDG